MEFVENFFNKKIPKIELFLIRQKIKITQQAKIFSNRLGQIKDQIFYEPKISVSEEIFKRSDYQLSYSEQDYGYRKILETMSFKTIQECNTFLVNCKLKPLDENPSEEYQDQEKIFK